MCLPQRLETDYVAGGWLSSLVFGAEGSAEVLDTRLDPLIHPLTRLSICASLGGLTGWSSPLSEPRRLAARSRAKLVTWLLRFRTTS